MALRGKWSRGEVAGLSRSQLRALRKNAERARDDQVLGWCEEALKTVSKSKSAAEAPGATISGGDADFDS
jgi:hypothetical protein